MRLVKYKFIKLSFLIFTIFNLLNCNVGLAQLSVGDQAPNLVLGSTNNSIQSFTFPNQNKVTLLFFWTTSVSKSKENLFKYRRLYSKYSDIGYKNFDGFDVISVALQSDKVAWENALKDYDMLKFNNCISQKGYSDFFVKTYKITETPSSFLIDELGKIVIINPSVKNIIDYLEDQRNVQLNTDLQTVVSGKIILGNANSVPVSNQKLFLLNSKNDTVQTVSTNESGAFEFDNINASTSYKLLLQTNSSLINDNNLHLFLASPNNEIVSNFKFEDDIYAYDLLECELPYLKSVNDNHSKNKVDDGSIEDLYTLAVLFNSKTSVLSKDAIFKLNPIIAKLKANPKTKLHIISHTDSNGDEPSNLALTSKQSNSIITLLVSKGISKSRLLGVAKGETEIINKCQDSIPCSDSEHGLNRRTEFKFYPIQ